MKDELVALDQKRQRGGRMEVLLSIHKQKLQDHNLMD